MFISFSSSNTQFYESQIFCLFIFGVFYPDKSFKLISKYTQKMPIWLFILKWKKTFRNTLNWGNWNSGFVKLVVHFDWSTNIFYHTNKVCFYSKSSGTLPGIEDDLDIRKDKKKLMMKKFGCLRRGRILISN